MALSRAATAGVGMLGGVVGLSVFLLSRGLPEYARQSATEAMAQTQAWVKTAKAEVATERTRLDKVVAEDTAYLGKRPEVKAARAAYDKRLATIDKVSKRIEVDIAPILKADIYKDRTLLHARLTSIKTELKATPPEFSQPLANVFRVRNYKLHHKSLVDGARANVQRVAKVIADPTLAAVAAQGQIDYPDVSERVQTRLNTLQSQAGKLAAEGPALEAAALAAPIDYVKVGKLTEQMQKKAQAVTDGAASLRTDIASLGTSSDKILVDMKRTGTSCAHKYRYVEGGLARQTDWVPVPCTDYKAHTEHLGMSVYSKPEGTFKSEAVTVAHPPGYSYIGNARYGRWDSRAGGRYWVWYGQYALTRDLLWGVGGYRPIRNRSWSSYRSSVKARKPYYGATKQYGTGGSATKTKYKSSSFLTKRRATFAASKYKASGAGKYRSSGSGSGNTRSGSANRSSRYRSSSFGGSGK